MTLRVYDSDGDGLVGRDELEEFYLQTYRALMRRLRAQATPPQALHRQDSQQFQDKLVASLEGRFVAQVRGILDQLFLALDGDGDRKLQPQEFLLFLKSSPVVSAQYELHFLRDGSPSPKASAELHKVVSGTAPLSLLSAVSSFRSPPPSRLHRRSCPVVSSSSSSSHSSSTSTLAPLPPSSSSTCPSSKSTFPTPFTN
ncbi:MAG: hypothetical protein Q8P67_03430 [archaeon]|nr:hypothetical protein [archaeon]